jgi:hypothetical protein
MIPAVRRRQDAALAAAVRRLVDDPNLPCEIDGIVIPDGWGKIPHKIPTPESEV